MHCANDTIKTVSMTVSAGNAGRPGKPGRSKALYREQAQQIKIYWALVKDSPFSTLGPPLLLLAVIVGLGVWGVCEVARQQQNDARTVALNYATLTGEALQLFIKTLVLPGRTLGKMYELFGSWPAFRPYFQDMAEFLVGEVPPGIITAIDPSPNGIWLDRYPRSEIPSSVAAPGGVNEITVPVFREYTLQLIEAHRMLLQFYVVKNAPGGPTLEAFARVPVYHSNVSADEDFGFPPGITPDWNCSACYDPETRVKYMGAFGVGLNLTTLSSLENSDLKRLVDNGYRLQLVNSVDSSVLANTSTRPGGNAVTVYIDLPGTQWTLSIEPEDGWTKPWLAPAIAAVVVVSCLAAVLLLLVLLSRLEHQMLLRSLVPQCVIQRTKNKEDFIQAAKSLAGAMVETGTPADKILSMMADLLEGETPDEQDVLFIRTAILQSYNLYEPIDLKEQMAAALDQDVTQALMLTLGKLPIAERSRAYPFADISFTNRPASGRNSSSASTEESMTLVANLRMLMASGAGISQDGAGSQVLVNPSSPAGVSGAMAGFRSRQGSFQSSGTHPSSPVKPPPQQQQQPQQLALQGSQGSLGNTPGSSRAMPQPSPGAPLFDEVEAALCASALTWEFDAFELEALTQGHCLSTLTFFLIHSAGLIQSLKLKPSLLARFLRVIEAGYKGLPYHNSMHAADVLQTFHMLISEGGMQPGYVDPVTHLACYLAAAVHDFEHMGLTNDFLVLSSASLAILYNDKSPMENHHLAASFALMLAPGSNFMPQLPKSDVAQLRKTIIDLVLGTDMKQHFSILSQFTSIHRLNDKPTTSAAAEPGREERLSPPSRGVLGPSTASMRKIAGVLMPLDDTEKLLSLQVALKCADLGSLSRAQPVHLQWVGRLEDEFFLQGDKEKQAGMTVSPLFDREKPGVSKSQVGFFTFVAAPLFRNFTTVFPGTLPFYEHMQRNKAIWVDLEHAAKEKDGSEPQVPHCSAAQGKGAEAQVAAPARESPAGKAEVIIQME